MDTKIDKKQNKSVIFLHIPKTAGTTLKHIVHNQYKPSETFEFYKLTNHPFKGINNFIGLSDERKQKINFITGHIGFGLHEYLPQASTYITVLRDPVKRVISFYYYLLRNNPNHEDLLNCSGLEDFVEKVDFASDDMTKYLSNVKIRTQLSYQGLGNHEQEYTCDETDLELAKNNLKEYFSVVGTTECFNETLVLLNRRLGWQIYPFLNANVSKQKPKGNQISEHVKEMIRERNKFDIELYQYGQSLFQEMIAQEGEQFREDVMKFENQITNNKISFTFKTRSLYNRASHKLYQVLQ